MTADQSREQREQEEQEQELIDVSRRQFLKVAGVGGLAAALGPALLTACAKGGSSSTSSAANIGVTGTGSIKVGVTAPYSGIASFAGVIVNNSLNAAVQQFNSQGGLGGRKIELLLRDTGVDPQNGPKVYTELSNTPGVVGILWCGAGLEQALPQIKRDGFPIVSVFGDLESAGELYPSGQASGRSVFQMIIPGNYAVDTLADYAKNDRGYSSAALLADTVTDPNGLVPKAFKAAMDRAGIANKGIETFALNDSDYGPQLQRIRAARPESLWIWGLTANTAAIVKALDAIGAGYVDTPTAKGPGWHPHIIGSPGATGDKSWVELAGSAAKVGTVTAWHVGGLIGLPDFAIAGWMKKYLNKQPTGGEESPADGLATLLNGIKKAGSTDRAKVVEGIETMGTIKFASIPFSFSPTRHLNKTRDDMILVTMERGGSGPAPTDPPYQLGKEWREAFGTTAAGPSHLVRPTLEANKRAHPEVMDEVLKQGYGTQCTKHADGSLGKECKIH
ncbi:MAG TPA: ABC transporter substrate-binding protein [Acidimicrobiales bacterium]|nr:ABC transporter substrate-binding protein [Acidimicrobiales bacterium]